MQWIIRSQLAPSTVITIAHCISTIIDANRVTVVSDGAIVELGPPGELPALNPLGRPQRLYEAAVIPN